MNNENKTNKEDIFKGLNKEQAEAVKHINGPLMIIAGAGSGKTKVLTHRIANLIDNGVAPYNILALTFTNKAANELKERIAKLVGENRAKYIWAGTFHSIFARILRINAEKLGYSPNFSIYDTEDSNSQIKQAIKELNFQEKSLNVGDIRNKISKLKNELTSASEAQKKAESLDERNVASIFFIYEKNLKKNNAMDFDDLLINMILLLRSDKSILHKLQNDFKYILIDEYQDTNKPQFIVINLLSQAHNNLCIVGDDAQSIYRWRGADISNILGFNDKYPFSKVIRLEQNYRSTKTILQVADAIISNNKNQIPKKLWSNNPEGDKIQIYQFADDREEATKIGMMIQNEVKNGMNFKDIAVLYRTNAQSFALENSFRSLKLPYIIIGGTSFFKRKEIKDIFAYLTLLVNPEDKEAFKRSINEPPRGIGLTSLRNIELYAQFNNVNLITACLNADLIPELKGKAQQSALNFAMNVKKYKELIETSNEYIYISEYIQSTKIIEMYEEIGSPDALDRLENIYQILDDIKNYFTNNDNPSLSEYLQQVSLVADIDEKDLNGNNISIMTLHSAKGLEFPVVFLSGVERGLFPVERSKFEQAEIEEERRLFYVGITRAKEKLFISYAMRRAKFGEISNQGPSIFVNEIPINLTNRDFSTGKSFSDTYTVSKPQYTKPSNYNDNYSQLSPDDNYSQLPSQSSIALRPGDRVKHINFGNGKITQITGFGSQQKVVVKFDSVGLKTLMLSFAKLEKL